MPRFHYVFGGAAAASDTDDNADNSDDDADANALLFLPTGTVYSIF
jgi:hypothetical protein